MLQVITCAKPPADQRDAALGRDVAETIVKLLAPIVCALSEELWHTLLGHEQRP